MIYIYYQYLFLLLSSNALHNYVTLAKFMYTFFLQWQSKNVYPDTVTNIHFFSFSHKTTIKLSK